LGKQNEGVKYKEKEPEEAEEVVGGTEEEMKEEMEVEMEVEVEVEAQMRVPSENSKILLIKRELMLFQNVAMLGVGGEVSYFLIDIFFFLKVKICLEMDREQSGPAAPSAQAPSHIQLLSISH
jgi:hypothetical protein